MAHITSIQVLIEMVVQDVGVAFVAPSWAQGNPDVVIKELSDTEQFVELAIAFRPRQIAPAARKLLELALQQAGQPLLLSETA